MDTQLAIGLVWFLAFLFSTTVHEGRVDKGMPAWKGMVSEDELKAIKAFVNSVQQSN